jgi:S1-C subfamily serine protease
MRKLFLLFTLNFLLLTAHAETIEILSGTGFYVSPDGDVITNEHVVQNCKSIRLKSADETVDAVLKAVDKENEYGKAIIFVRQKTIENQLKKMGIND